MNRFTHTERAELPLLRALAWRSEVPRDPRRRSFSRVLRRECDPGKAGRPSLPPSPSAPLESSRDPVEAGLQLPALPLLLRPLGPLGDPRVVAPGGHRRESASRRAGRREAARGGGGEGGRGRGGAGRGGRGEEHAVLVERRLRRDGDGGSPPRHHLGREVEPADERDRHRGRGWDGEDLELRQERGLSGGAVGEPERRVFGGRASHVRPAGGFGVLRWLRPALQLAAAVLSEGTSPPPVTRRNTPRTTPPSRPSRSIPREICSSREERTADWPPGTS